MQLIQTANAADLKIQTLLKFVQSYPKSVSFLHISVLFVQLCTASLTVLSLQLHFQCEDKH